MTQDQRAADIAAKYVGEPMTDATLHRLNDELATAGLSPMAFDYLTREAVPVPSADMEIVGHAADGTPIVRGRIDRVEITGTIVA